MGKGHCWIGTSGWSYKHWDHGVFYPEGLKQPNHLPYFAERFSTVELNTSFYHLPKEPYVIGWRDKTPEGFLFAVKLWKMVTHWKRLRDCREPLETFFQVMNHLGEKRGPLLIQLAPGIHRDDDLLKGFLEDLSATADSNWRLAMEFRHKSWLADDVFKLLEDYRVAVVVHDMPGSKNSQENDVDFVYLRRHGGTGRYAGSYSQEQLEADAERIRLWLGKGLDVFVYYNNDTKGYAIRNASELKELLAPSGVRS
jgi:uncharacterized protein YecE (DUF72 family)